MQSDLTMNISHILIVLVLISRVSSFPTPWSRAPQQPSKPIKPDDVAEEDWDDCSELTDEEWAASEARNKEEKEIEAEVDEDFKDEFKDEEPGPYYNYGKNIDEETEAEQGDKGEEEEEEEKPPEKYPPEYYTEYDHVPIELATVKCPAARGQELNDYWRCLWRSTITTEGMRFHDWDVFLSNQEMMFARPFPGYLKEREREKEMEANKSRKKRDLGEEGESGDESPVVHDDETTIEAEEEATTEAGDDSESSTNEPNPNGMYTKEQLAHHKERRRNMKFRLDEFNKKLDKALEREYGKGQGRSSGDENQGSHDNPEEYKPCIGCTPDEVYNQEKADGNLDSERDIYKEALDPRKIELTHEYIEDFKNGFQGYDLYGNPVKREPWPKYAKVAAFDYDIQTTLADINATRRCQLDYVKPGLSFRFYLECLLDASKDKANFAETHFPESTPKPINIDVPYNELEYKIPNMTIKGEVFRLEFKFSRITVNAKDKDNVFFAGADPYLSDQVSEYRYKFNNLISNQKQPAWTYAGKDGAGSWHELKLEKFYTPLTEADIASLKNISFLAELAQAYPGVGEVADELPNLPSPYDYRWEQNQGYHAQTRFLLPVLVQKDLDYYKSKKAPLDVDTVPKDEDVIDGIIKGLEKFLNDTQLPGFTHHYLKHLDNLPYNEVYKKFLLHYYKVDFHDVYKELGDKYRKLINYEYNTVRVAIRSYVSMVIAREKCLKEMVKDYDIRRGETDVKAIIKTITDDKTCPISDSEEEILAHKDGTEYTVRRHSNTTIPKKLLEDIYKEYYDRKEARERYGLPVYPYKFPICQHPEPSPINVITSKARKSALRNYELSPSGYRLNKFFMEFANDGTPLLYAGIVDGERLDDSSVTLSGGAVKGQNLTFQYMFFRFSHDWKKNGSEHRIDSQGTPMEIQMLFTISGSADQLKYYHILARVANQLFQFRGKLVIVISLPVEVLETDDKLVEKAKTTKQDPWLFEPFAQAAYLFRKQWQMEDSRQSSQSPRGYVSNDPTFRLIDFFPQIAAKYYTYRGSLTWPPCFGYVIWSVFNHPLYISKRQFDQFANIPAFGVQNHNLASDNARSIDDLYVEQEADPKLEYAAKQKYIEERTVDRFLLLGQYDPENPDLKGVVEDVDYFNKNTLIENGASSITTHAITMILAYFLTIIMN